MASYYSEPYLRTGCSIHNEWIEAVFNMAASQIRLNSWYRFRGQISPPKFRQFIEKEESIFDGWYRFGIHAKQQMDIRSFYN